MLRLVRIVSGPHPAWSGEGAWRFGGRWNAPGQEVIYASLAQGTAMLEVLVHANTGRPPSNARIVTAEVPDDVTVERVEPAALPGWEGAEPVTARAHGAAWWSAGRSAVLLVPSVVAKLDLNAVVNPRHPDAARIAVSAEAPLEWDRRLFRFAEG